MSDSVKKILVVGDDEETTLLTSILQQTDAATAVESATSAAACLARLEQENYDVVVVDPRCVSQKVVQQSFKKGHNIPIVVVTDIDSQQADEPGSVNAGSRYVLRDSDYPSTIGTTVAALLDTCHHKKQSLTPKAPAGKADSRHKRPTDHALMQATLDGISDVVFQVDDMWRITFANKRFLSLFGEPHASVVGMPYSMLLCQKETPCEDCPVTRAAASGKAYQKEERYLETVYQVSCHPVPFEDGARITVHCKDLTESRNLENHLLRSEKLASIGLLASGIAHELRNPLNIIETARYYLESFHAESNEDMQDKLDMIRRSVKRSAKIINSLLQFVRPAEREQQNIPLKVLIENTVSLVGKECEARNIDCHIEGNEELSVFFSADDLRQVLLNLIMNSMQAMPDGGCLSVKLVEAQSQRVELHISDTGVGIPSENLSHIFSPFFTTKQVGEGTGLGLYLSHLLLERGGGQIQVESDKDSGTTFVISLPRSEKPQEVMTPSL